MNARTVTIAGREVGVIVYQEQPVITLAMMDQVHERPEGTAGRTFREHKEKLIVGEDYFRVTTDEIRRYSLFEISPNAGKDVVLLTETGYLMLVKSFTDALAWQVQRQLVKHYFATRSAAAAFTEEEAEVPFDRLDASLMRELRLSGNKALVQGYCLSKGVTPEYLNRILNQHGIRTLLNAPGDTRDVVAAPLELLAARVPEAADQQDRDHWFLLRTTFERVCGDYDVTATARHLRDHGYLAYNRGAAGGLTFRARPGQFGKARPYVFAIRKRLAQHASAEAVTA